MARLFAYGTLMCPEIFEKVAGMVASHAVHGTVKNHRCLCVRGEAYPGIVQGSGGEGVKGLVYTFPAYLWPKFDAFEGEQYVKKPVTVRYAGGKRELVHAYLFRPEYRYQLTRTDWNFDAFMLDGKQSFMARYFPTNPRP